MPKNRRVVMNRKVVYGEGDDECMFLRYIRDVYSNDPTDPAIKNGYGGTPMKILKVMRSLPQLGGYSERMAIIDNDRNSGKIESARRYAKQSPEIKLLFSQNRFESEMLRILGAPISDIRKASSDNAEVGKEILNGILGADAYESYKKLLPKKKLDEMRATNQWLDEIISFIE